MVDGLGVTIVVAGLDKIGGMCGLVGCCVIAEAPVDSAVIGVMVELGILALKWLLIVW